jgi:hypothetical protein
LFSVLIPFFPSHDKEQYCGPQKGCIFSQFDISPATKVYIVTLKKALFLLIIPLGLAQLHFMTLSHESE